MWKKSHWLSAAGQVGLGLLGLALLRLWIFCISKGFNHGDQQSTQHLNWITFPAGFME
jgi:hypothetical protein